MISRALPDLSWLDILVSVIHLFESSMQVKVEHPRRDETAAVHRVSVWDRGLHVDRTITCALVSSSVPAMSNVSTLSPLQPTHHFITQKGDTSQTRLLIPVISLPIWLLIRLNSKLVDQNFWHSKCLNIAHHMQQLMTPDLRWFTVCFFFVYSLQNDLSHRFSDLSF